MVVKIGANVTSLQRGLATASRDVNTFAKHADKTGQSMQRMGKTSLKAGVALGAGIAVAVRAGMKFDKQMSVVRAATQANEKDFQRLRQAALKWGANSQFSATQVAEAMTEMGKAGFKTNQTLSALPGVLAAAAASGESMATVSNIMVNTLTGFGLAAGKATMVSDALAFSANATTASIGDFGEALKYVAPVAKAAGISFHETNGALIALAKVGIQGSMAGTSLRGVLQSMLAPNKRVSKSMKEIGLSFRDAKGNMLPLAANVDKLRVVLARMPKSKADQFLARMFGRENIAAAQAFLDIGGKGLRKFEQQSIKSAGSAAKFASILRDNLSGDLENMGGAAETAAIKIADDLTPSLRGIAKSVTSVINAFNSMDPAERKLIVTTAALGAAFLTFTGIVGVVGGAVVRGVGFMSKGAGAVLGLGGALRGLGKAGTVAKSGAAVADAAQVAAAASATKWSLSATKAAGATATIASKAVPAAAAAGRMAIAGRLVAGVFGGPLGISLTAASIALPILWKHFASGKPTLQSVQAELKKTATENDKLIAAMKKGKKVTFTDFKTKKGPSNTDKAQGIVAEAQARVKLNEVYEQGFKTEAQIAKLQEKRATYQGYMTQQVANIKRVNKEYSDGKISAKQYLDLQKSFTGWYSKESKKAADYTSQIDALSKKSAGLTAEQHKLEKALGITAKSTSLAVTGSKQLNDALTMKGVGAKFNPANQLANNIKAGMDRAKGIATGWTQSINQTLAKTGFVAASKRWNASHAANVQAGIVKATTGQGFINNVFKKTGNVSASGTWTKSVSATTSSSVARSAAARTKIQANLRSATNVKSNGGTFLSSLESWLGRAFSVAASYASKIKEKLSNLDPHKRNSPSLVDRVTSGVATINRQFQSLKPGNIKSVKDQLVALTSAARNADVTGAVNDLSAFGGDNAGLTSFFNTARAGMDSVEKATIRTDTATIRYLGNGRKAGNQIAAAYQKGRLAIAQMQAQVPGLETQLKKQQKTVDDLASAMDDLRNIQLAGTQGFSDASFANQQAQNALELQKVGLQLQGMSDDAAPIVEIQKQLDTLGLKARQLDLQESLQLDPLRRQWEQTINPIKELSFNDAIAQWQSLSSQHDVESAKLATLQDNYDTLTAAIERYTQALEEAMNLAGTAKDVKSQRGDLQKQINGDTTQISKIKDRIKRRSIGGLTDTEKSLNTQDWQEIARLRAEIKQLTSQRNNLPQLATGGIVRRDTIARIGENNRPEAIIPLDRLPEMMGGGGGGGDLYVTVSGNQISSEYDIKKIANDLVKELRLRGIRATG